MSALALSALSRFRFVPAAVVALTTMGGATSAAAMPAAAMPASPMAASTVAQGGGAVSGGTETAGAVRQNAPRRAGTTPIKRTISRDAAIVLAHLRQQLVRVTGVAEKRPADIETLGLALEAARTRPIKPEGIAALADALATALAQGTFEETTLERLAEDLFAALNNRALTGEQAALLAVDVASVLQDAGAQEPHAAMVLTALQRVCPGAVLPAAEPTDASSASTPQAQAATKRALLVLSRGSSE
jgi:hypothetical protein